MSKDNKFPDAIDIFQMLVVSLILFLWAGSKMAGDLFPNGSDIGIYELLVLLLNPKNFVIDDFVLLPIEHYALLFYSLLVVYAASILLGFFALLNWLANKRAYRRWKNLQ